MKKFNVLALAFTAIFFVAGHTITSAQPEAASKAMQWQVDPAHSTISFEIRHFFTPVLGRFHNYSSQINFNPNNLDESRIDITIDVNSLNTDNQKRDGHLQSADFFNAEKYPEITFKSDKITQKGENKFVAHGTLKIKGVPKEVELPFTLLGMQDHPQKPNTKIAGIKIDYTINRNNYNVGTGSYAETSVIGVT
jgi:polyisoprenoid-binding protein YceI